MSLIFRFTVEWLSRDRGTTERRETPNYHRIETLLRSLSLFLSTTFPFCFGVCPQVKTVVYFSQLCFKPLWSFVYNIIVYCNTIYVIL